MKSGGAAKSYHKITMYVYLFFYFILFLLVTPVLTIFKMA